MITAPRRVITANRDGVSHVASIDFAGGFLSTGAGGGIHEIWSSTAEAPLGASDPQAKPAFAPGAGGSSFRIVRIPPDDDRWNDPIEAARATSAIGQERPPHWAARHPGMHLTATLDYVMVLEGELIALLEKGEVALQPGDVLIQRATPHAWKNPGKVAALLLVTMIGLTERQTA